MIRSQTRFTGQVQGVGFRYTTRAIADRHPVTGWVRNEPDGSVTVEAQAASDDDLEAFLQDLRSRLGQHIADAHSTPLAPAPGETGFDIRY
jgi:acylphosphatase